MSNANELVLVCQVLLFMNYFGNCSTDTRNFFLFTIKKQQWFREILNHDPKNHLSPEVPLLGVTHVLTIARCLPVDFGLRTTACIFSVVILKISPDNQLPFAYIFYSESNAFG